MSMNRPWRRLAFSGSVEWPTPAPWQSVVTGQAEEYLTRMPPDSTLYIRHGHADEGVDAIVHAWVQSMRAVQEAARAGEDVHAAGFIGDPRPDVEIIEELVPADWDHCNPHCKEVKANGEKHRRPNPGYPHAPRRGSLPDYCPSAGHWRNPHVVGFTYDGPMNRHERKHYHPIPGVRVSLFCAFIFNNSSGTSATLRHAQTVGVPWRAWGAYGE